MRDHFSAGRRGKDCSHISQSYQPLLEDYPFGHLHRLIRFIPLALGFGQPHGFAAVEELIDLFRLMAKLSGDLDDVVVFSHGLGRLKTGEI